MAANKLARACRSSYSSIALCALQGAKENSHQTVERESAGAS